MTASSRVSPTPSSPKNNADQESEEASANDITPSTSSKEPRKPPACLKIKRCLEALVVSTRYRPSEYSILFYIFYELITHVVFISLNES